MAERKSFLLRLSPDLYEALERWARDDLRSVNAQIEFLLRRALDGERRLKKRKPGAGEGGRAGGGERDPGPDPG